MTVGKQEARGRSGRKLKQTLGRLANTLAPFVVLAVAWELTVRAQVFPTVLFPSLGDIFGALVRLGESGLLFEHIGRTLYRLGIGYAAAVVFGTLLGFLMGRFQVVERFFAPLFTVLLPVPALAWLPLFILWFGIGDRPAIILVFFASSQYIAFNTWSGIRTMNPVWSLAAKSLNIRGPKLFYKIILPASLPMALAGYRLGIAQAWRAVVAGEMIAATSRGLGFMIFNSRQYLQTEVMLAAILVIAVMGLILEKLLFNFLEARTTMRWGTVANPDEAATTTA